MTVIRELLRLLHAGRQHWSVAQCERDVERAKHDLALALEARDRAFAALRIAEPPPRPLPTFLRVDYDPQADPYPLHLSPRLSVIDGDKAASTPTKRKDRKA